MTNYSHGALENEIMNAVWTLEEDTRFTNDISVNDVLEFLNKHPQQELTQQLKPLWTD